MLDWKSFDVFSLEMDFTIPKDLFVVCNSIYAHNDMALEQYFYIHIIKIQSYTTSLSTPISHLIQFSNLHT